MCASLFLTPATAEFSLSEPQPRLWLLMRPQALLRAQRALVHIPLVLMHPQRALVRTRLALLPSRSVLPLYQQGLLRTRWRSFASVGGCAPSTGVDRVGPAWFAAGWCRHASNGHTPPSPGVGAHAAVTLPMRWRSGHAACVGTHKASSSTIEPSLAPACSAVVPLQRIVEESNTLSTPFPSRPHCGDRIHP